MQETTFLNVDLHLRAKSGLSELLDAFGDAIVDLKCESEDDALSIELAVQPQSIDEAILSFFNLINALSPKARSIWDGCETRCIDIGIQAGEMPYSKDFRLSNKAILLLSSIGAEVLVTVYAAQSN